VVDGSALKTPTAVAATRELSCAHQQTVPPMKRSASLGAVSVDDVHQASASHQSPTVNQPNTAASPADLRSDSTVLVHYFCVSLLLVI